MPEYHWNHWIDPIVFPYILPVTQIALTGGILCICVCISIFFTRICFFPSYSISILLYFCFPCSSPQCKHKAENLGHAMGHNFFCVALLAQQSLQFVSLISIYMMFNVHHTECCLNEIILTISL